MKPAFIFAAKVIVAHAFVLKLGTNISTENLTTDNVSSKDFLNVDSANKENNENDDSIFYTYRVLNQTNMLGSLDELLGFDQMEPPTQNNSETIIRNVENLTYHHWRDNFLKSNYDRNIRPNREERATEIQVSIHIIRIHSISERTMDFGLDMYYRENWTDPRLAYDVSVYGDELLHLPPTFIASIWSPDTYFSNAVSSVIEKPGSVTHKSLLKIYPNGLVYYIRKISLIADCAMDLSLYPFDKQGCQLILTSYSFTKKDLLYKWRDGDPIDFQETVRLPEFELSYHKPRVVDEQYYIGTYSTLHLCLVFKRSAGFCIIQVFFPATAVVLTSWISLWMEEDTQFNDILSVILAIIFLAFSYNSVMPKVSYVKLLDLFLGVCFMIVFLSLSKLVILKYCRKKWRLKYVTNPNNRQKMNLLSQVVVAAESSKSSPSNESAEEKKEIKTYIEKERKHSKLSDRCEADRYKRKMSFQHMAAMAIISNQQSKREEGEKRFLRLLRSFHISTQMALPISFGCFFLFVIFIYPNWPRADPC